MKDYWDCDYIFIDTAGRSHQNADQLEKMKEMVGALKDPGRLSCVSGISVQLPNIGISRGSQTVMVRLRSYELIFTKLDETEAVGNLLNMKLYTGCTGRLCDLWTECSG